MNLMSQSAFRIRESNCPHSLIKLSTRNIWIMFTPSTIHYPYMNNAMIISIIWNTSTVPCYIGEYCKWFCDNVTSIKPWILDPKKYSIIDDMDHTLYVVLWSRSWEIRTVFSSALPLKHLHIVYCNAACLLYNW